MVKDNLLEKWMDNDEYLIRFLRTKKLDLEESKEYLLAVRITQCLLESSFLLITILNVKCDIEYELEKRKPYG